LPAKQLLISKSPACSKRAGLNLLRKNLGAWLWREAPRRLTPALAAPATRVELVEELPPPALSARAALVIWRAGPGVGEVLLAQNAEAPLPLASISKLVTALVAKRHYQAEQILAVQPAALVEAADAAFFRPGDQFTFQSLLYPLLVESSNNAAMILAEATAADPSAATSTEAVFVAEMNELAARLGMSRAQFYNPSGLDAPDGFSLNRAAAYDLFRLADYLLEGEPELLAITRTNGGLVATADGLFHHQLTPTNQLLAASHWWPAEIVGGKTGQTDLAGKNLLLILRDEATGGHLVTVVLGTDDNFADTAALVDWVYQSFRFVRT